MPNNTEKDFNAETNRVIIQTARRLFLEFGFRAVSTRRIADACGLTQPALYHHFANKQELYLAVHREMLTETGQGLERIVRRGEGLKDSLSSVVRYLLTTQGEDPNLLFHDLEHELSAEVRDSVSALFRENVVAPIASIFASAIDQQLLQETLDGASPITATYLLLSMIQSMAHMSKYYDVRALNTDRIAALIAEILVSGLPRRQSD